MKFVHKLLFLLLATVVSVQAAGLHGELQNGYSHYELTKNPKGLFNIDEKTGVVTLAKSLINCKEKSLEIEILATSDDTSSVKKSFIINVVEAHEKAKVDMYINAIDDANTQENTIAIDALVGSPVHVTAVAKKAYESQTIGEMVVKFGQSTGIAALISPDPNETNAAGEPMSEFHKSLGRVIMILITFLLFYLAIKKGYEPLLLIPIAFGGLLANIPVANIAGEHGFLGVIYNMGIANELFPILIFMGVGAMTDFGPLLSNPRTALLGGAAQFGIFATLVGAAALSQYTDIFDFTLKQASAISIIGGADGPTSIYIASTLAPELLGAIAVASYSYMALVPIIQPPIMKALTSEAERKIKMVTSRHVSRMEKLLFPIMVLSLSILILPDSTPLIGAFMFGNFVKESGVVERLNDTLQNGLINIVTIFLGLGVGSKLAADQFLVAETLAILVLGLIAFAIGTAAGVIMAKIMNKFTKDKINPLIGSAGVSAVPMAARVSNKVGMDADRSNMLLMHAMGPNVAGVIGSAVAAGVMISFFS